MASFCKLMPKTRREIIRIRKSVAKKARKDKYTLLGMGGKKGLKKYQNYTKKLEKMCK